MGSTRKINQLVELDAVLELLERAKNNEHALGDATGDLGVVAHQLAELLRYREKSCENEVKRYQVTLDGAALGSWDFNLKTGRIVFDRRWCEMLGLKLESTPQVVATWDSRLHPDDREKAYSDIKAYLDGKTKVYENIHRIKHADGHWMWILDRGRISEYDEAGKPLRFAGIYFDITAFKEHQLLSEEIQKMGHIGGWELDVATGETRWTPETYRIHAIAEDTPTNKIMGIEFYAPHEKDRITRCVTECIGGKPYCETFEFYDAKGRKKWVEAMGQPKKDALGKVYKIIGTFQDVTDKVEREEENRFILDALGIGVWKYNPTTQHIHWDKSLYRLYGIDPKDFSSHYEAWESSLTATTKAKAIEELQLALAGTKEFDTTFEIETPQHERKFIAGRGRVIRDPQGQAIIMYGVNFDRTKEEQTSQLLELEKVKSIRSAKLASLGEMSAGIAHEINNPLSIIHGIASSLHRIIDDRTKLLKKMGDIKEATERISKIVRSLKKFSRSSESSEKSVHVLKDILHEAIVLTESKTKRAMVSCATEFTSNAEIMCDEIEIEQVFVNLINNAVDAVSNQNDKWIKLHLFDDTESVVVRITDSGPGVEPAIVAKLFEPFFTTKPVGHGTGLGLSIVKGILDEHQAKIELVSPKNNTCFEIRFQRVLGKN